MKYSNQGLLKESVAELFENEASSSSIDTEWLYETKNGEPLPHHISLTKFKPYPDPNKLGNVYTVSVLGLAQNKEKLKVAAVLVQLPDEIKSSTGADPHISVAILEGGIPFNSQKLNYRELTPIEIGSVKVKLVNAPNNSLFAEDFDEIKAKDPKGSAQLVLFKNDHDLLKTAAQKILGSKESTSEESGSPQEIVSESIDLERWKKIAGIVKG